MIIEKHIPIPTGTGSYKYPWETMDVGESFFMKLNKDHPLRHYSTMSSQVSRASKRFMKKFVLSKYTEGNREGIRIWREE